MKPCLVLMASVLVLRAQTGPGPELGETYKDVSTGLIIHYPVGWRLDTQLFQGFNIIDFPQRQRPPQVFVPMNRADIGMGAPPEGEKTIAEWMRKERINESQGYQISEVTLTTKRLGTLSVTVARGQPSVIPGATSLLFFFEIEGRPIKAVLTYRGRSRASEFEGVFDAIIKNLEPLSSH